MDFESLKLAIGAGRTGVHASSADLEAVPLTGSGGESNRIALRRGRVIAAVLEAPWERTVALAFSDDDQRLAAAGHPSGVCVWQVPQGRPLARLPGPRPWATPGGRRCLPLLFAARNHLLLVGGGQLAVVETSGWSVVPVAQFPVVALAQELHAHRVFIVGPEEEGEFPVEELDLDSFTISACRPILREHPTTTFSAG